VRWQFVERMAWLPNGSGVLIIGHDPESTFQQIWEIPAHGGRARKITNDLSDYIGLSITADSRQLTTLQYQVLANIWIAPKGDVNAARQITSGGGRYYDLAWTPAGKILYCFDASDTVDVWEREPDGSGLKQLTSGARRNYAPAVSPDGRYVVFHTNRAGAWNVWRMDADGSDPRPLTVDNASESHWPQVSPDSKWVIFQHPAPAGSAHLWKVPMEGGVDPIEMTGGTCRRPEVSPATGMIACWYSEDPAKPRWRIAVFPPEGVTPVKTFDFPSTASVDTPLRWTPDGSAITYLDNGGSASNLWSQPLDGSPARPLTNFKAADIFSFAWSRDGRLAYSRGIQTRDVVLITDMR